jgi:hypothetical protein
LKESYPVLVAEYTVVNKISQEERVDHPKGEDTVLEEHSQVWSGIPEKCEAIGCNQQEHGDHLLERCD